MTTAVELRGVVVRYGAVTAVRGVSLAVERGAIHAVVGENGAGKSTLMRALYGLVPLAAGEVRVKGEPMARPSPEAAIARGVGMVHQHFLLAEALTVAENVVLGREPRRRGLLDVAGAEAEVGALAEEHGLAVDPAAPVGALSVGERQRVEILKALYRGADVLILDEPTAVLSPPEVDDLFAMLRAHRDRGGTVILVTHKLDEVMAISERVTVLRRGEVVGDLPTRDATPEAIVRLMVGRDLAGPPERGAGPMGDVRLSVEGLTVRGSLDRVSLEVRGGEILGVAGVEGNGQTELCEAITGLRRADAGIVRLDGADVTRASPARRRALGLGHVPEDRHRRGLLLDLSLAENLLLGRLDEYTRFASILDRRRLAADAARLLERFDVRPADPAAPARSLSGGNQQKVVLARELSLRPRVLLAAQPTRGVDVGAIERIHAELDGVRRRGAGVLLISAELDELLALADRVAVLYRGRIVATLPRAEADRERLGGLMTGATAQQAAVQP